MNNIDNQMEQTSHQRVTDRPGAPHDYRLRLGPNGWSTSPSPSTFRVFENMIKIKQSDGRADMLPPEDQRNQSKTIDDEGGFSKYVQQAPNDGLFQLWMRKIAPYLADWVLGLGPENDRASPSLIY